MHPEGHAVATGEIGAHPKVVVWDASTGVTLSVLSYHKKGVSNVVFAGSNGALLISVGMDDDRTISVHNWKTQTLVGTGKAGRGVEIYTVSVGGGSTGDKFVTGGKNHVKFWDVPSTTSAGGELSSKAGKIPTHSISLYVFLSSLFFLFHFSILFVSGFSVLSKWWIFVNPSLSPSLPALPPSITRPPLPYPPLTCPFPRHLRKICQSSHHRFFCFPRGGPRDW